MKLPDVDGDIRPTGLEGSNYLEDPLIGVLEKPKDGDFQLTKNFQGVPDQGYYIPPDPYLAVGPNHIIATVNSRFRILDKSGVVQKTIEANTWYNTTLANSDPFDPKVIYDHFANRWVMVWLSVQTSTSWFLVSVSDDADPNGVWYNWKLPSNVNGNTSAENIVISLNDGTNDYVLFKIGLSADDTYILDFGGEGMVVPYGYTLKGYTTTADTVNYVIFGTKEI